MRSHAEDIQNYMRYDTCQRRTWDNHHPIKVSPVDMKYPVVAPITRQSLAAQIKEFLANGGVIQRV